MYRLLLLVFVVTLSHASLSYEVPRNREQLTILLSLGQSKSTYDEARDYLFTRLDNFSGKVCSVYDSKDCMVTNKVPNAKIMNTEHTWPQSKGATGTAKSDLHHLFITGSDDNSMRSSLPFCDVNQELWTNGQSKRGYNIYGEHCFEPPAFHKGNVARAMFYFSVRYNHSIDKNQEMFLRQWANQDPIDQEEVDRNEKVFEFQKNRNLFIDSPELVNMIKDF